MGFRQVAPGLLVSTDFQITIDHPDPCWIVHDGADPLNALATSRGKVLIFSAEELAQAFLKAAGADDETISSFKTVHLTWDELVNMFAGSHFGAVVDHLGRGGFCAEVPLEKDI